MRLLPLAPAALALLLGGCQILQIPMGILRYGMQSVQWLVKNAGGLAPLATMLVMADPEEAPPANPAPLDRLLTAPPRGALAAAVFPASWLDDPERLARIQAELLATTGGQGTTATVRVSTAGSSPAPGLVAAIPVYTPRALPF